MNHQDLDQPQEELEEYASHAYPTSQAVSPTGEEYSKTPNLSLCTGYISAGSGTQIVVYRLYP